MFIEPDLPGNQLLIYFWLGSINISLLTERKPEAFRTSGGKGADESIL